MPAIRILPDAVASQIAAGEVVERPVAAVKELVENSLDAGATRIRVEFEEGGKRRICVEDDGCGMAPDECLLALERHATSKVQSAGDLARVTSFGFRGEALPSLASVSRFVLRSRPGARTEGTEVTVDSSRLLGQSACGMPPGTSVQLSRLFHAVPARRKFLKATATEAAHIVALVRALAVAHPEVGFTLVEDGRERLQTSPGDDLATRVAAVFGRALAGDLESLDVSAGAYRLHGLLARRGVHRPARADLFTYVNRRPVDSRAFSHSVQEALRGRLPRGTWPPGFLFLTLDPAEVDVNVHPSKREIRFRREREVRTFLQRAVSGGPAPSPRPAPASPRPAPALRPEPFTSAPASPEPAPATEAAEPPATFESPPPPSPAPAREPAPLRDWRHLGELSTGELLFETPGGLLLLHRRGARERILYERILGQLASTTPARQTLLLAPVVELAPAAFALWQEHAAFFAEAGFTVEPFGGEAVRLRAVPAWLPEGADAEGFLRSVLEEIARKGLAPRQESLARQVLARLAVQQARFTGTDAPEALAAALFACAEPLTDPLGRPTVYEVPRGLLRRHFRAEGPPRED